MLVKIAMNIEIAVVTNWALCAGTVFKPMNELEKTLHTMTGKSVTIKNNPGSGKDMTDLSNRVMSVGNVSTCKHFALAHQPGWRKRLSLHSDKRITNWQSLVLTIVSNF